MAGIERLADYQDVSYAALYLDRLEPIRDLVQPGSVTLRCAFGGSPLSGVMDVL